MRSECLWLFDRVLPCDHTTTACVTRLCTIVYTPPIRLVMIISAQPV